MWTWILVILIMVTDALLCLLVIQQRKFLRLQARVIGEQIGVIQCQQIIIESFLADHDER